MHSRHVKAALVFVPLVAVLALASGSSIEMTYAGESPESAQNGGPAKKPPQNPDGGTCNDGGIPNYTDSVDPADPCASLMAQGAPQARAAWVDPPYAHVTLTSEMALSWLTEQAARIPLQNRSDYTLEVERCDKPAHSKTICSTSALTMSANECGTSMIRFGLDPTQYNRGINQYSFTLRLRHGCVVDSVDTFNLTLDYQPAH